MKFLRDLAYHLQFGLVVLGTTGLVVGLGMLGQYWLDNHQTELVSPSPAPAQPSATDPPSQIPLPQEPTPSEPPAQSSPDSSLAPPSPLSLPTPSDASPPVVAAVPPVKTSYGHLAYPVIDPKDLIIAGDYYGRKERLHKDAAAAFQKMVQAARQQGITLKITSGFRDENRQQQLFYQQLQRKGSKQEAAKWSAPPGYSEHHTGFALDIGDGTATDFKLEFAQTNAYRWLRQHAEAYGFELSFPEDNAQGVSFEPWHWRFVGNTAAQTVFQVARRNGQS